MDESLKRNKKNNTIRIRNSKEKITRFNFKKNTKKSFKESDSKSSENFIKSSEILLYLIIKI